MRLGMGELLIILVVALLIFGPAKIPQLGEALGKGLRSFKKATEQRDDEEAPAQQATPAQLGTPTGAAAPAARSGSPAPADVKRS